MKQKNDYYFIDTILDKQTGDTLYYVIHQKDDGSRVVVDRWFRTYQSAEELLHELNDNLLS